MSASASEKKILLKSADGKTFELEEVVALQMPTIKQMIEDNGANQEIPLPNVTSSVLSKVIEYCKKHVETRDGKGKEVSEVSEDELKAWDTDFLKVDQSTLFDLVQAAHYLNIKSLLDLTCQAVADIIKRRTPEEIRKIFNITNEFIPPEEEKVRRMNPWAFQ